MGWFSKQRGRLARANPSPLPREMTGRLGRKAQLLLEHLADGRVPDLLVRTGAVVDVGEWFRRGRVYGMCLSGEWVMFAAGKLPFVERVSMRRLSGSVYNHIVGELVLAPAPDVRLRQLGMSPLEAGRVLRQFSKAVEDEVKKEKEDA